MNKQMFFYELKTIACKKTTIFSAILLLLYATANYLLIINELPSINLLSSFESFVSIQGGGSGLLFVILPLSLTLATGSFFIKERNSSLFYFSLTKINSDEYIKNKLISVGVSNFSFMLFCQITMLICALIIFPVKSSNIDQGYIIFGKDLLYTNPLIYCAIIILNSGLMSIFFGFISVIISLIFKNLYAAIMLPYVIFIGLSEVLMSMPAMIGLNGIVFYNFSPLVMTGDYIASDLKMYIVTIYWIILIILSYKFAVYLFDKKFRKETLFI